MFSPDGSEGEGDPASQPGLLKITIHQHLHSEYRPPQVHKQRLNPSRRNSAEYCVLVIVSC